MTITFPMLYDLWISHSWLLSMIAILALLITFPFKMRSPTWNGCNCQTLMKEHLFVNKKPLHCAKSYRPFELFVNENHKLKNDLKPKWHFREVRLKIPWRNPFSAEMNGTSAWQIIMSSLTSFVTVVHNDSSCCAIQKQTSSRRCWEGKTCSRYMMQTLSLTSSVMMCLSLSWATFFTRSED